MSDLRTAAQQALEALEAIDEDPHGTHSFPALSNDAITALRAALAQQEQEPVADAETWLRNRYGAARGHHAWRELIEAFNAGRTAAQEQGPVAWTTKGQIAAMENGFLHYIQGRVPRFVNPSENDVALYTHPPRREWQSLTEEEIGDVFYAARNAKLGAANDNSRHRLSVVEIARAIEAALKEKNHD